MREREKEKRKRKREREKVKQSTERWLADWLALKSLQENSFLSQIRMRVVYLSGSCCLSLSLSLSLSLALALNSVTMLHRTSTRRKVKKEPLGDSQEQTLSRWNIINYLHPGSCVMYNCSRRTKSSLPLWASAHAGTDCKNKGVAGASWTLARQQNWKSWRSKAREQRSIINFWHQLSKVGKKVERHTHTKTKQNKKKNKMENSFIWRAQNKEHKDPSPHTITLRLHTGTLRDDRQQQGNETTQTNWWS